MPDFKYLHNVGRSLSRAADRGDETAVASWASRALATVLPEPADEPELVDVDNDLFLAITNPDEVSVVNGAGGLTFTLGDAKRWWTVVFAEQLNIAKVRSVFTPGSRVLSEAGYKAAVALGVNSTNFAPEDFNPLGLEPAP